MRKNVRADLDFQDTKFEWDPSTTGFRHMRKCYRCFSVSAALKSSRAIRPYQEPIMKAFVIAAETIKDEAMFARYRKEVLPTIERFGGKFIVRGGNLTTLEGEWPHPRLVIIEFPSRGAVEDWYKSAEYQKIISLRLDSSAGSLIVVDGHE